MSMEWYNKQSCIYTALITVFRATLQLMPHKYSRVNTRAYHQHAETDTNKAKILRRQCVDQHFQEAHTGLPRVALGQKQQVYFRDIRAV